MDDANSSLLNNSPKLQQKLLNSAPDSNEIDVAERRDLMQSNKSSNITMQKEADWKPAINQSYETMVLTTTANNSKIRPAGFRSNGRHRQIKNTSMMSKIRTRCRIRKENPKLAVCITMYNEDETELQTTLRGCLHNYNCLKVDETTQFTKDDFLVVVICDGYERIPESLKKLARDKGFLDEEVLFQKGFMDANRELENKMNKMQDVMDESVKPEDVPTNILHCFQVTTWDFGIEEDLLKGRRINFMFCIKQRNDGKINSHRWFFQGVYKYLKP